MRNTLATFSLVIGLIAVTFDAVARAGEEFVTQLLREAGDGAQRAPVEGEVSDVRTRSEESSAAREGERAASEERR